MNEGVKKAVRTAQSHAPWLKTGKDDFYRVARRTLRRPHDPDFAVIGVVERGDGEVFVDIGANHGQSIESIRLFDTDTPVHSFEASPELATRLTTRYRNEPKVVIHPYGLGDTPAELTLFVPTYRGFLYDGLASMDRDAAAGWLNADRIYRFDPDRLEIAEVVCEVQTLDDQQLRPAFVKVDVQGLEYEVLAGGRATLEAHHPVLLVEDLDSDPRLPALLADLGYAEFHIAGGQVRAGRGPGANAVMVSPERPLRRDPSRVEA